jgi:hypothetical protein
MKSSTLKLSLVVALSAILAACGGGGGGNGNGGSTGGSPSTGGSTTPPASNQQQLAGKAIDGYLAGATVCFDNGAGACDATLPSTTTDANGNYSMPYGSANITGKKLLVVVSPSTKDLSRPGYTFPASFQLTSIVTDPTTATNITPISTMVESMMESGLSEQQATQQVSTLLGEQVNLSADYIATGDTTALNFATQVVNAVTSAATNGTTDPNTVRALMQAMVVNNTLTPSAAQVAAQLSQPVYSPTDASQILAKPTYGLNGYLPFGPQGPNMSITGQAIVEDVRQIANNALTTSQQQYTNGNWSAADPSQFNAMIGAYELKGDASDFTSYIPLANYGALPLSNVGPQLSGTDPNTGINFTYEFRTVDLSNKPLATAAPIVYSITPLWTANQMTSTNFPQGTSAYQGILSYATDRVVIPVWSNDCGATSVSNGEICPSQGGSPVGAFMDGNTVVPVSGSQDQPYANLNAALGQVISSEGGGLNFVLAAGGIVQQPQQSGGPNGIVTTMVPIGTWTQYSRNANVAIITFNAGVIPTNYMDPLTAPLQAGASEVVAIVHGHLMTGWYYPTSYAAKAVQFANGLPQMLIDTAQAVATSNQ